MWAHTNWIACALNGTPWGWTWAPALQAALPANVLNDGRWDLWHQEAAPTLLAGNHFELGFEPSAFIMLINGVAQVPNGLSGNAVDPWATNLCAALVSAAKESITVFESGGVAPNNYLLGGAYTATTRNNLTITSVLPSNTIIVHGIDNTS